MAYALAIWFTFIGLWTGIGRLMSWGNPWLGCLVLATANTLIMHTLLHLFQLESYQLPGYFRALRRVWLRAFLPGILLAAVVYAQGWLGFPNEITMWLYNRIRMFYEAFFGLLWMLPLIVAIVIFLVVRALPSKKPLVYTPRMKRLIVAAFLTHSALLMGYEWALRGLPSSSLGLRVVLWLTDPTLHSILNPLWLVVAALLVSPVERKINQGFFADAQRKLDEHEGLIRIGITGSYGKTSTKFLLKTLLDEKYKVYATPASYNTPMGVTRVIREQLAADDQVFIAEMGARHVGDISEMCELVHPTIGILTSVGPQHLDTFGTIEAIAATKYELIEWLPTDGKAFFARDGAICERLYAQCELADKTLAGQHLSVADITTGPFGSRFALADDQGRRISCETKLLGEHNIMNLLLCCEVALALGLSMEQLAAGIAKLTPVEHRLQLLDTGNGVTVIDDAFNSNPNGAKAAMAVLAQFPPRRIVITPGMVELGDEQDALNRAFGEQMAHAADIAILIGKRRTDPIAEGLLSAGFDSANLHRVSTLDESTALLATLVRAGDTVLYENDLPDNYAE